MDQLLQDVRYALRMLWKSPAFTAAALLTLALGIGANSTIFSVMSATLLKPLPFPGPDRLTLVWKTYGTGPDRFSIISAPNLWDWQKQNHVFERMAVFDSAGKGYNLAAQAGREAEQVSGVRVSSDFFAVLGVSPFLGRTFLPEEEIRGKDHEVILSYGLWQRRFGGDRALVGKTIRLDGEDYTLVGVMPQSFQFQFWSDRRELWVPAGWTDGDQRRDSNSFVSIARLKPGITVEQANAELEALQGSLAKQFKEDKKTSAAVVAMDTWGLEHIQRTLLALLAAVTFVLLIGCVNVANLMLARGTERRKEFAIRRALGASTGRILRTMMAESILLSLLGGALGLTFAIWGTALLSHILPRGFSYIPFRPLDTVVLDTRVFVFTLAVSAAAGVLFGIAPALTAVSIDVNEPLKEGSRGSTSGGRQRLRHVLVASEVGLALIVLVGAGLMIETMARLLAVDPGFKPKNLLKLEISLPQVETYYGPPVHARFCQDLQERVGSLPGVLAVSAAAHLPMVGGAGRSFYIEGRPVPAEGNTPNASYTVTCPDYFRAMGAGVLKGREFNQQDTLGSTPVIVVNQRAAQKYWPNEDPVGRRIKIDPDNPKSGWTTVVGVVGNMRNWGLDTEAPPQIFRPYTQAAWPWMNVVVRTAAAPATYVPAIKKELTIVEPERPVDGIRTMEEVVSGSEGNRRFMMLLLVSFASLAVILAVVGIVGVAGYSVNQRRHEIGIRIALGAQGKDVLSLVLSRSMAWVMAGIGVGVAGALAMTRLLGALLYGTTPTDPAVMGIVAAGLCATALLASYLPARKAATIDPMVALRGE